MFRRLTKVVLTVALAAILPAVLGCLNRVSIADLNHDPARYSGKEVTISGTATGAFGGFGNGIFQVDDGTGKMWVLCQNYGLPGEGSKVSVTGEVQQGISFGGRNYGVMLRQTKARD